MNEAQAKEIVDKIDKVFNRFGEVKSEASPVLKTLRTEIQHAKKHIQENFSKTLSHLSSTDFLDEIKEKYMGPEVLKLRSEKFPLTTAPMVLFLFKK